MEHIPVLKDKVVELFAPVNGTFIDATVGAGGHSDAICAAKLQITNYPTSPGLRGAGKSQKNLNSQNLNSSPSTLHFIGLDQDYSALTLAAENLKGYAQNLTFVHGNFRDIKAILAELKISKVNGILADLGMSSMQLDDPTRGFSFRHKALLDMRMAHTNSKFKSQNAKSKFKMQNLLTTSYLLPTTNLTAELIVKTWDERKLADILWRYGEERFSRKIARAVREHRRDINSTTDLAELCEKCIPPRFRKHAVHPATKTFQALRIAVNDEVDALKDLLRDAPELLAPGGRLAIISFHSLEDRLVKQTFNELASSGAYEKVTKKPIIADDSEIALNPRARSAKLRCIVRI